MLKLNSMDYLSLIKTPIETELSDFIGLFNESLTHTDGLLSQALEYIRRRTGKQMRPMLILLMAKNYGLVTDVTLNAAVGLELLHTASLVHDDVVDESDKRRGQASVNAAYDNKVAVLVGDYLLSTALLRVACTRNVAIVEYLSQLGRILASGEILQLAATHNEEISETVYYQVIKQKTAALFEACCAMGVMSAGASEADIEAAKMFGRNLGIIFQIRDDIFDYYQSPEIGKPTGNDMAEGKLTLPVIHALKVTDDEVMRGLAMRVRNRTATADEISMLIDFAKANGGIEYAERRMAELRSECVAFIDGNVTDESIKAALTAYLDFVIERRK